MRVLFRNARLVRPLSLGGLLCVFFAPAAVANTLCTRITQSGEHPIPIDERESARQVQARIMPAFVAEGDKLAGEGELAAAQEAYAGVFGGYTYAGTYFDTGRCLSMDFYQGAADKLRNVATELAKQRKAKGYLLDESRDYGVGFQRGALRLYLTSNQYDEFIEQAIAYAESELMQRDIDRDLVSLVDNRLEKLYRMREIGTEAHNRDYVNDLTPLLDEELAAFDKLGDFEERLLAHLRPLYPRVTDHWLAEEAKHHDKAINTDGMIPKAMVFGRATGALASGIKRLDAYPNEVTRLKTRASARGKALMKQKQYPSAVTYFELAGNEEQAAKARRLAEKDQYAWAEKMEASVKADVEKMTKSEDEQAAFQDEADEMAAEFGFDLED